MIYTNKKRKKIAGQRGRCEGKIKEKIRRNSIYEEKVWKWRKMKEEWCWSKWKTKKSSNGAIERKFKKKWLEKKVKGKWMRIYKGSEIKY